MLDKIKKHLNISILISFIFILFGIFCILKPETSFEYLVLACGIIFIVSGIVFLISNHQTYSFFFNYFLHGILTLIIGIIITINPEPLKAIFPFIIAIWFIASGISNFKLSIYLKEASIPYMIIGIIMALISVGCGLILVLKPLESLNVLIKTIGITIIINNISNIVDILIVKKYINPIIKKIKLCISEF